MIVNKKILVVVDSIDVNDSSGSKGRVALIKNLATAGFKVRVLHYSFKEIDLENVTTVLIQEIKCSGWYVLSRLERLFTRITKINLNPTLEGWFGFSFTFFNDVKSIQKALQKEKQEDYNWVLTLSKAASFRPHAAILKLPEWYQKWLAYVHDPYPMHAYPRPYDWVEPGHHQKRAFFLKVSEKAFKIIYPSQYLGEWMESYYPPAQGKTIIIPHQIDNGTTNENTFDQQQKVLFQEHKFIILHAGNLMSARNPMGLLNAYIKFLEAFPEAKEHTELWFIGHNGIYSDKINELAITHPTIHQINRSVPFQQVLKLQETATVNIILEAKGYFSPFLPGKFAHCIKTNKPILLLGPEVSESRRILGNEYPYWCSINEVDKIKSTIESLYKEWKSNNVFKMNYENIRNYLSPKYLKDTLSTLK